jgi:flavin-dependent dehydrogenase
MAAGGGNAMTMSAVRDVAILGGGLAGLTLALQLRAHFADLDIVVIERRAHPVPPAAHKVGESTVEIGAHYFSEVLGLRAHLEEAHIRKFGFRFFFSEGRADIENVTELGVRRVMPTPTWQIDRGLFENFLGEEARRRGIDFRDGAIVRGFDVGSDGALHVVRVECDGAGETLQARWLVDASGRAGLVKHRLGLALSNGHDANAAWFRLDDRLDLDGWCDDGEWQARCSPRERWRSTNHFCGPGYWAWLIPLGSGAHSVGIVCDAGMHPIETMNSFDRSVDWLAAHQPAIARECAARRGKLMDFRFLRGFSYGSTRVFSGDRWALTGEAGVFLDPFYSPGSDFIAIANTYIVELVALDRAAQPIAPYARIFEQLFFSFYENTLTLYRDQYPMFGDAEVMPIKVVWDYAYYWGVLCQLVFQQRLADLALLGSMRATLDRAQALNRRMQAFFRLWHAASGRRNERAMLDQRELDWFVAMNRGLHDVLTTDELARRLGDHVALMDRLAAAIGRHASMACSGLDASATGGDASAPAPSLFARAA